MDRKTKDGKGSKKGESSSHNPPQKKTSGSTLSQPGSEINEKQAEQEKQKGNEYIKSKDYQSAINCYERSISFNPNEATTYFNRALCYFRIGDSSKALIDCNSAIYLKNDYYKAFFRRGDCFLALGDLEKAFDDFSYVQIKDPSFEEAKNRAEEVKEKILNKNGKLPSEFDINEFTKKIKSSCNPINPYLQNLKVNAQTKNKESNQYEPMNDGEEDKAGPQKNYSENSQTQKMEEKFAKKSDYTMSEKEAHKVFGEYEAAKEEASVIYKKGNFDEAIEKYTKCINLLEKARQSYNHIPISEFETRKSTMYNNISACFSQKQMPSESIRYCSMVIDSEYTDPAIRLKVYLRRGLAYEKLDKLKLAKEDMTKVKEMQPDNLDASKALHRISGGLEQEKGYGVESSLAKLEPELVKAKEDGNKFFRDKDFAKAIEKFTEGINTFMKLDNWKALKSVPSKSKSTVVCQLFTNRSLAYFQLNNFQKSLEDADFVINYIDASNLKAFIRRSLAYSKLENYEMAIKDTEQLIKIAPDNKEYQDDLQKLISISKKKKGGKK